ncbi:hypothetical protein [Streptomyces sp. NPDC056949]|uniref:hypothetical protein n=1 Tax=Streptomyces sp. NPDC056949 TaxID=3345976 RepID=UPI00362B7537
MHEDESDAPPHAVDQLAWAGGCSGGEERDGACLRRRLPPLRRGQAWEIPGRRSGHTLLVIAADPALSAFPRTAVTVLVDTTPDTLLSTRITAPVVGDVIDTQIMTLTVSTITAGKYLGIAPEEEKSAVSRTLRIALDLTDQIDAPARVPTAPQRGRVGGDTQGTLGYVTAPDRAVEALGGFVHAGRQQLCVSSGVSQQSRRREMLTSSDSAAVPSRRVKNSLCLGKACP